MQGNINVQTENIFPVIKKFLYSDHEIFLRELVSNAVDATQKLKTLSSMGKVEGDLGDLTIEVKIQKGKLIISDHGIGMTAEEIEKYITQIAFSGAEGVAALFGQRGRGAGALRRRFPRSRRQADRGGHDDLLGPLVRRHAVRRGRLPPGRRTCLQRDAGSGRGEQRIRHVACSLVRAEDDPHAVADIPPLRLQTLDTQ